MSEFDEKKRADIKAVAIGLLLIVFIAGVTIFKANTGEKKTETDETQMADEETIDSDKIRKITTEQLAEKIQTEPDLILIDLRDNVQYAQEHLIDSVNVELSAINPLNNIFSVKKATYVFITQAEDIAPISSIGVIFSDEGYEDIYYLEGGFKSWKNKFNPTISAGDQNSFSDQAKVSYISSEELKTIRETEKNKLFIIDTRKADEFLVGHLLGAVNLSLEELEKRRKEIPIGKKIIVYDNTTARAFKAAVSLFDLGFSNTFILSKGMDNWKSKGYEIVK